MKKISLIVLILFLLNTTGILAQTGNNENIHSIHALAVSDSNTIRLRWSLSDNTTWQKANQYGYTITRKTIDSSGIELSYYYQYLSLDTLATNIKPLTEGEWQNIQNDKANVASQLLYSDTLGQFNFNNVDTSLLTGMDTFAIAVRNAARDDNRYDFSLAVASQDFDIAEKMALGFEDTTCEHNKTYIYKISVNFDSTDIIIEPAYVKANLDDVFHFPAPEISAEGIDSGAIISWKISDLTPYYTSYRIERRTENTEFEDVIGAPFVFGSQVDDNPDFAYFVDTLADNRTEYIYRIAGYTYFGDLGPYSDTVHITGKPARLPISINFDYVRENEQGEVRMVWNHYETIEEYMDAIEGFNIYKSKDIKGKYQKINTTILNKTDTVYIDQSPYNAGYYVLECIDTVGYSYMSYPYFEQLTDSIPPGMPVGLTGNIDLGGKVTLNWAANSEDDLLGYRIFTANQRDTTTFVQQTDFAVEDTMYYFYIDPNFEMDTLYIKILAEDTHSNYSDFSEIIALARPDLVGPSQPVLVKAYSITNGVQLEWRYSETEDLDRHELWRKPKNAPGWKNIFTIDRKEMDSIGNEFIDTLDLENRVYQYRLLAYDDAGNATPSNMIEIRPMISMERGKIENLRGLFYCNENLSGTQTINMLITALDSILNIYEHTGYIDDAIIVQLYFYGYITAEQANQYQAMPDSELAAILYNLRDDLVALSNQEILCGAILGWDYNYEELEGLSFKIYRGILQPGNISSQQSGIILYKTIKATDAFLTDYQTQSGISISFPLSTSPGGNDEDAYIPRFIFIDNEAEPRFKYYYRVMASWEDGGYTKLTDAVIIDISPNQNTATGQNLGN